MTRLVTNRVRGLVATEHCWALPLDHNAPEGERIDVFGREVVASTAADRHLPWLVFFNGGPGGANMRPLGRTGWLERACDQFRVLLLDQRGTGRSTPLDATAITARGDADAQARFLRSFRADSIVRDAELIRSDLGIEKWSVLGQSFGGFCVTSYLSFHPTSLERALITAGVPPLHRSVDEVYRATYSRMLDLNRRFYERYPQDVERAREIYLELLERDIHLPSGDRLTPRRFQTLGLQLGMTDGFEVVHYILEGGLDYPGLRAIENAQTFDTSPLYLLLHEACWANGGEPTRWAAERARASFPEFGNTDVIHFTGEHLYPEQLEEHARLRPLRDVAQVLAADRWPDLYDADRLSENETPVAAAVFSEDPYVESSFSMETGKLVKGMRVWLTNEFSHDALRTGHGAHVVSRLLDMTYDVS